MGHGVKLRLRRAVKDLILHAHAEGDLLGGDVRGDGGRQRNQIIVVRLVAGQEEAREGDGLAGSHVLVVVGGGAGNDLQPVPVVIGGGSADAGDLCHGGTVVDLGAFHSGVLDGHVLLGDLPFIVPGAGEVAGTCECQIVPIGIGSGVTVSDYSVSHIQAVHGDGGDDLGLPLAVVGQAVAQDNFGIGHILGVNFPIKPIFPAGEVAGADDPQRVTSDIDLRCHIDLEGYRQVLLCLGIQHLRQGNIRGLLFAIVDQASAHVITLD